MKRRLFLQLLGFAPAVVALPALARRVAERPMTATEVQVLNGTSVYYNSWMCWTMHTRIVTDRHTYEFAMHFDNWPTAEQRAQYHEIALLAFQRMFNRG